MAEFTNTSKYEETFDPRCYLDFFYIGQGSLAEDFIQAQLENFHKLFSSGKVKGKTVIDIGTAPCIYQLLSACEAFDEIIATWHTKRELRELQKWQNREAYAHDWSSIMKYVCELEGNRVTVEEKETKLRGKIKQTLFCDVSQTNPMAPADLPKVDCVITIECLEVACRNHKAYSLALKNISNLLKPGGHLVIGGDLETSYYMMGDHMVSSLPVTEKFLRDVLGENGYHIIDLKVYHLPEGKIDPKLSDYGAFYFLHAQKM
ncbi:nicotinamide N-methyltransferase-like [Hyperolius riggenbachi]|uniref:nicotinamide N-methyltransferase-like n=1 Tax=Hyperolius riggenbachi TaxID=752182 RepID=UPI0035A2FE55